MNRNIVFKIIVSCLVIVIYIIIYNSLTPVLTNEVALTQMKDTEDSFLGFNIYNDLLPYSWIIPLIICLLIFRRELVDLYYMIRGGS